MFFFFTWKSNLSFYGGGVPLAVVVVIQLGRFVRLKELCALRDDELNAVMLLFFDFNSVGAFGINIEIIIFWIDLIRESCFIGFIV